jgi:hypothetical protein
MQLSEKARFFLLQGVLGWGIPVGLGVVLLDWYKTHHL